MKLLTVIVTYNAMSWVERCLSSLLNSTIVPDVIVIDNGSTDGTQTYIKEKFTSVIFIQSNVNLGFGKANNIGLQYALDNSYDYIYLLNQDAWVMPDTFEKLIEISNNHPEYGVLSPFQMNADMQHIDKYFNARVCSWKFNKELFNDLYNQSLQDVYPVKYIMAAHWLLTRRCVEIVGGFSPSFPHYGEDDNYADRIHFWNYKLGIVPSLRVVHDRGDRQETIFMKIYQVYIDTIIAWSSPIIKKRDKFKYLFYNLKLSLKYRSFKPFIYFIRIITHLNAIINNRKISISRKCSFLNLK